MRAHYIVLSLTIIILSGCGGGGGGSTGTGNDVPPIFSNALVISG